MQWQTFVQDFVHLECFNCINIFNGITIITNYYSPFNHQKIIKNKFFARKVSKHFTIQATRSLCNFSIVVRQNGHQTCHLLTTCPFDYSGTHEKEKNISTEQASYKECKRRSVWMLLNQLRQIVSRLHIKLDGM